TIRAHDDSLAKSYFEHGQTVDQIRHTLLTQIFPNVLDELGLDEPARDWAQEWLHDDLSIFRTLKRHKFTKAFALESLRSTQDPNAFPTIPPCPLHLLPPSATDILKRPILVLRLAKLDPLLQSDPREHILRSVEGLRLHLHNINSSSSSERPNVRPVLQYILLVDIENASMRNFNIDLLTWYAQQVAPRYPGLFGTVFIINFSWTQSGIWSVIKLALPESVHYRIFFPSRETLHECISPNSLPQEYGGNLPLLPEIPNLLDAQHAVPTPCLSSSLREEEDGSAARSTVTSLGQISPRSRFNPFYGYPIGPLPYSLAPAALPYLRYGRRRKRDLLRTLAALWWEKWGSRVSWSFLPLLVFFCTRWWWWWWWRQRRKGVFFIRGRHS
ncbi:CRAL-TRIO domain-containing protein, partial [Lactifluus volemus]